MVESEGTSLSSEAMLIRLLTAFSLVASWIGSDSGAVREALFIPHSSMTGDGMGVD